MTNLGVENFRKFKILEPIELKKITYLVGPNNGGKSSFTKALMLLVDNLKSEDSFGIGTLGYAFNFSDKSRIIHINDFKRALFKNAERNQITFSATFHNFYFEFDIVEHIEDGFINGLGAPNGLADVSRILIRDSYRKIAITIWPGRSDYEVTIGEESHSFNHNLSYISDDTRNPLVSEIKAIATTDYNHSFGCIGGSKPHIHLFINNHKDELLEMAKDLNEVIIGLNVEYFYAHLATQNAIIRTSDNTYMSKVLSDYMSYACIKEIKEFIEKWMSDFKIGESYYIVTYPGETYSILISDKKVNDTDRGNKYDYIEKNDYKHLADYGMGSIQLMTLIFQVASTVLKLQTEKQRKNFNKYENIIIVEEPEQNLHPKTQSLLAEFFTYCAEKFGIKFVVETHSEYIIRKTQLEVAQSGYKDEDDLEKNNPREVYWIGDEVYPLQYRTSGYFIKDFGEGFYDNADDLAIKLFDLLNNCAN